MHKQRAKIVKVPVVVRACTTPMIRCGPFVKLASMTGSLQLHQFVLVTARKSRAADHWSKDDYDVRLDDARGPVVRIMLHPQTPK
jgi:hypothetical protein